MRTGHIQDLGSFGYSLNSNPFECQDAPALSSQHTWGGSYGTSTLCLPVMGSSTYWAWLFPSTLIRWLGGAICPARAGRQKHHWLTQAEVQGSKTSQPIGTHTLCPTGLSQHTHASPDLETPLPKLSSARQKSNQPTNKKKHTQKQCFLS